jgi:hypothetical protein
VPCRQYSRNVRNTTALIRRAAVAADTEEVTAVVHPVYPRLPAPEAAHFEADNTIFVEEFRIRGNEAGPDQRANIITIANLLQVCTEPPLVISSSKPFSNAPALLSPFSLRRHHVCSLIL